MKFLPAVFALFAAPCLFAQDTADPVKLGDVTFTATLRSRIYAWDWFQPAGSYTNQYGYSGSLLRLNFAETRGALDLDAEIAVPLLLGLPSNATAPAPQGGLGLGSNYYTANGSAHQYASMAFAKQLYTRWHISPIQTIQTGRFEFNEGTELTPKNATLAAVKQNHVSARLIGTFAFSDVGRSFDGFRYSATRPGAWDFTAVGATPTRGVFQTDGWGWNRVAFGYAALTKQWGKGNHAADTRFFFIDYDDFRHILKTDNRSAAVRKGDTENIHIQTWAGHSIHVFSTSAGIFDEVVWAAAQTGKWGTQTQRAYAFDLETGYQPGILPALKPWLRAGITRSSGDGNPNDNNHGTFFQLLPTPRGYARFPFFNMMNLEDAYGSLMNRPAKKLTITSEFHSLRLANAGDLWYSGGGVFQPWTFGYTGRAVSGRRSLANLYDTQVDYRFNAHLTLTAYLGVAQGKSVMQLLYPADSNARFGYIEALFRM